MSTYLEQLEAMSEDKRKAVCKAMLGTMYAIKEQLGGLADNHPVFVKDLDEYDNPNNTDFLWDRLMCLKWLAEGAAIIDLKYMEDYKYVVAGIVLLLFGALNYYTHIGDLQNTTVGTHYKY